MAKPVDWNALFNMYQELSKVINTLATQNISMVTDWKWLHQDAWTATFQQYTSSIDFVHNTLPQYVVFIIYTIWQIKYYFSSHNYLSKRQYEFLLCKYHKSLLTTVLVRFKNHIFY